MLKEQGKNPFTLDSKEPTADYIEFITSETRYTSLKKMFPQFADQLYAQAEKEAKERLEYYKNMASDK